MGIVNSLLKDMKIAPQDRPVALLMRHSARFPILHPAETYTVGLTEEGVRMAEKLGGLLAKRFQPGRLLSSPVGRCITTAEAITRGAGWPGPVQTDERLSHPFIAPVWQGIERGDGAVQPGAPLPAPVQSTLALALAMPDRLPHQVALPFDFDSSDPHHRVDDLPMPEDPRLDVLVTHDTIVGAVVAHLLRLSMRPESWPGYLEGIFLWRDADRIHALWRGVESSFTENFERIDD